MEKRSEPQLARCARASFRWPSDQSPPSFAPRYQLTRIGASMRTPIRTAWISAGGSLGCYELHYRVSPGVDSHLGNGIPGYCICAEHWSATFLAGVRRRFGPLKQLSDRERNGCPFPSNQST